MDNETNRGRPTKYDPNAELIAVKYSVNHEQHGDAVPAVARLARIIGVSRSNVYLWARDHEEFSDALEAILAEQEAHLITQGLRGQFSRRSPNCYCTATATPI